MDDVDVPAFLDELLPAFQGKVRSPLDRGQLLRVAEVEGLERLAQVIGTSLGISTPISFSFVDRAPAAARPFWIEAQPSSIRLCGRGDLNLPFDWWVAGVARELAQFLLVSMEHPLSDHPKSADFTAMLHGYQNFIANAEVSNNNELQRAKLAPFGFLLRGSVIPLPEIVPEYSDTTTRMGYLSSGEAQWARMYLRDLHQ